jgi:hypothetical protein
MPNADRECNRANAIWSDPDNPGFLTNSRESVRNGVETGFIGQWRPESGTWSLATVGSRRRIAANCRGDRYGTVDFAAPAPGVRRGTPRIEFCGQTAI